MQDNGIPQSRFFIDLKGHHYEENQIMKSADGPWRRRDDLAEGGKHDHHHRGLKGKKQAAGHHHEVGHSKGHYPHQENYRRSIEDVTAGDDSQSLKDIV